MSLSHFPQYDLWVGLSTDTKPTATDNGIVNGDKFLELDTSKEYRYSNTGTTWYEVKASVETVYGGIVQGNLAIDGTAQQLDSDTDCKVVTVQADPENAGYLLVGNSNISDSAYGAKLSAGSSVTLHVSNVNLIYVKGTASDAVSFIGEV